MYGEIVAEDFVDLARLVRDLPRLGAWSELLGQRLVALLDSRETRGRAILVLDGACVELAAGAERVLFSAEHRANPEATPAARLQAVLGQEIVGIGPSGDRPDAIDLCLADGHRLLVQSEACCHYVSIIQGPRQDLFDARRPLGTSARRGIAPA